jgi:hypothetical protein
MEYTMYIYTINLPTLLCRSLVFMMTQRELKNH